MGILSRYTRWLHTGWPAGSVEPLPEVREDGSTNVPGLYIVGDLTGIPLLKFSSDSGARAVRTIVADERFQSLRREETSGDVLDLVIVGAGVSGVAAAMEARKHDLSFEILESTEMFSTIENFPKAKPIYTYPTDMRPAGDMQFTADVKEDLVDELLGHAQEADIQPQFAEVRSVQRSGKLLRVSLSGGGNAADADLLARRVIVAIGTSGEHRKLGVPGEDTGKVYNRLHDPDDFRGRDVLVVGGGDSAVETSVALGECGARVTLSYRKEEFSRPKPDNIRRLHQLERAGKVDVKLSSAVERISPNQVILALGNDRTTTLRNDVVFTMIGRKPPLDFLRRSGVRIRGEWTAPRALLMVLFLLFCAALYDWKSGGYLDALGRRLGGFPFDLSDVAAGLDPTSLVGITVASAAGPAFWYTLAYSLLVVVFGFRRIKRRRTPYVRLQTLTLMAVQVIPLFLLPEILLPWFDKHGLLPGGLADALFPVVDYGHGREFWRAYGLILAWPLMVYNIFTDQPLWGWIVLGSLQTLVVIPALIYFWGKGAYCGWICSCGALAETLGDTHRHKMPHGPGWNRLNMLGQGILAVAVILLLLRIAWWISPDNAWLRSVNLAAKDGTGVPGVFHLASYKWFVDVFLAGVLGYGLYFWFSGRMWCRFACPLAALMHIYARFSRFRILADKKKCISCNVCTSVCHQGIDVMNFANKGRPMEDVECVRCSACVQSCPTGVLRFGQVDRRTGRVLGTDGLAASPVQMAERSPAPAGSPGRTAQSQ